MKVEMMKKVEIDVAMVEVTLPVRYEEEQIPNSFPLRNGDTWMATIEIDSGKIIGWPEGESGHLYLKVVDEGKYRLLNQFGLGIDGQLEEPCDGYVPHGLIPGEYGDYVELKIDDKGVILNWPRYPSVSEFFPRK